MAYLMLYGNGWTQRWRIPNGGEHAMNGEIIRVGRDETTQMSVLDPGTDAPTTLVVDWSKVAVAVILGTETRRAGVERTGQYA